jgi:hypothetical protein
MNQSIPNFVCLLSLLRSHVRFMASMTDPRNTNTQHNVVSPRRIWVMQDALCSRYSLIALNNLKLSKVYNNSMRTTPNLLVAPSIDALLAVG